MESHFIQYTIKSNKMSTFPKYIAVRRTKGYKVYKNVVTNGVNVLSKTQNLYICLLSNFTSDNAMHTSSVRSDAASNETSTNWSYTGDQLRVHINQDGEYINLPVIDFRGDTGFLPRASDYLEFSSRYVPKVSSPGPDSYPSASGDLPIAPVVSRPSSSPVVAAQVAKPTPSASSAYTFPPHVKNIIISDSIRRGDICPILSETLTENNAVVTTCGHVFTSNGINTWLSLSRSNNQCPVCKHVCHLV